ncbi:MAG TPA: universal stress protein [Gaiellaceae bacterium]|jgi:nucleotide-binding universal stress UspA family protein|nr:universal stress protein [Gaiellaceae bacterium]
MNTIVVGYDDTEPSKRALERAADLADKFGSRLLITSVAPVMIPSGHGEAGADPTDPPQQHELELEHARSYLAGRNLSAELQPAIGDPADTIVEVADQNGATLIVVGTRQPSILERLLGTSVSGAVSRHAHCDVLIVH